VTYGAAAAGPIEKARRPASNWIGRSPRPIKRRHLIGLVLAAADTAKEARDAALKRSLLPILYQVPETLDLFAGYAL
jgi:hypothetical protein